MSNITLSELYSKHAGKISDKWSLYLQEYESIFSALRQHGISLLEIGVQNGGSLEIWAQYFPCAKNIIGCDINIKCKELKFTDTRIDLVVGDANSPTIHNAIMGIAPELDIVIDDGSHKSSDIVKSFSLYFPYIKDGGLFIAEDLHCSYWRPFEGGLLNANSSIEFFKRLADIINFQHWTSSQSRVDFLKSFEVLYGCVFSEYELAKIHSIQFINSMCVIRKRGASANELGHRVIVGDHADVNSDILPLKNTAYMLDSNLLDQNQKTSLQIICSRMQVFRGRVWRAFKGIFR